MSLDSPSTSIVLQSGISLRDLATTGSSLEINSCFSNYYEDPVENEEYNPKYIDVIGHPIIVSFETLNAELQAIDEEGFVKKKIIEKGGGIQIDSGCTVSIVYSGYWENEDEPFEIRTVSKPFRVDLNDNGLLPGLQTAIMSMLVGELSMFLLSYEVMYGIMGNPPKIRPKSKCVYFIKLVKSILTPKEGEIKFSDPNIFQRVHKEVRHLYLSGIQLHSVRNVTGAIQCFKRAVNMLHKCRLANESEERIQEKLLNKLYLTLAICYIKTKQPLKACTACNEIHRLNNIWSNGKALLQNAKALRMIGDFEQAEKKLKRAIKLIPDNSDMKEELELLKKTQDAYKQSKIVIERVYESPEETISEDFKTEINKMIEQFKTDKNLCKLILPVGLNSAELTYIETACKENDVFCNKIQTSYALDKPNIDGFIDDFELDIA